MPLEEVPCSSPRPNSQRAHNTVCSSENYVLDVDRFLGRISPVCGAGSQRRTFSVGTGLLQGGLSVVARAFRRRSRLPESVISRVNHPRRDLARSIGICPASPPTP